MKSMDSSVRLGANRSDTRRYREDLQRRMAGEDTNLREHDILARYGGEEFVVLLPATMGAGAHSVAEKLRVAIEAAEVITESTPPVRLSITVSIGLSSLRDNGHDVDAPIARADAALYQSKRNGKNRWTET